MHQSSLADSLRAPAAQGGAPTANGQPAGVRDANAQPWACRSGPGRRPVAFWLAVFAAYAAVVAVASHGSEAVWGAWAAGGYGLAAVVAWCWRGWVLPLGLALAGGLAVPMVLLSTRGPATAAIGVVARSASLLLHHGTPYLPPGQLVSWRSYNPYLPAMAIFGVPRAAGVPGVLGDPRLWLIVMSAAALAVAFAVALPHRAARCGSCRRAVAASTVLALASPVLALPLSLGVTDPPVIVLVCVALACVARPSSRRPPPGRPDRGGFMRGATAWPVLAGLAVGAACALKATAWPALPVLAIMLASRDGARAAARFTITSLLAAAALIAVTAPALVARPRALVQNVVAYPLGLAHHLTPAASPLPGHLLASTGHAGHIAALALLLAAGLAVAVWLVARPPATSRAAAMRLAAGLTLLFLLAPATRVGYVAYPAALLGWLWLTAPPDPGRSTLTEEVAPRCRFPQQSSANAWIRRSGRR